MTIMTLPAFPVSIMGTVVNKRARYSLHRAVGASEALAFSCRWAAAALPVVGAGAAQPAHGGPGVWGIMHTSCQPAVASGGHGPPPPPPPAAAGHMGGDW